MNRLTLYRRHAKACVKGYPQAQRIFRPQTPKEAKADCTCPLVVDGSLANAPGRIRGISTETNVWNDAEHIKTQWEAWGQFTDPHPTVVGDPTIEEATGKFLEDAASKNLETATYQDFAQHFRLRLKPFCAAHRVSHVRFFENVRLVRDCIGSWRNVKTGKSLGATTQRAELERLRSFLSWCVAHGWLKNNHAKARDLKVLTSAIPQKLGLLPGECARVFDAINRLVDCYGRTGERNAMETLAFCLVMRHTGLRISDVTRLESSQLVPRASGTGWAIQVMAMKKTKEYVRIPIPPEVYDALAALPFKDGQKYWFYTGVGRIDTAVKTWRKRITNLLKVAQTTEDGRTVPFEHHATPHTFRHTFAISHLNVGTDVKMVSRWLGHATVAITEQHYGHANTATHIASESAYDESMRRQNELMAGRPPVADNVVSIRQRRGTA